MNQLRLIYQVIATIDKSRKLMDELIIHCSKLCLPYTASKGESEVPGVVIVALRLSKFQGGISWEG
jgi:hypothetical protein